MLWRMEVLLVVCVNMYSAIASRSGAAGSAEPSWEAGEDDGAPNSTRAFGTQLQTLVQEVSEKISNGLNRSYSLAVHEDAKYKELREQLRSGLEDLAKGQEALQSEAPREQLRNLDEIRRILGRGGHGLPCNGSIAGCRAGGDAGPQGAQTPSQDAATRSQMEASSDSGASDLSGQARMVPAAPHLDVAGGAGEDEQDPGEEREDALLHRSADALRHELTASEREEASEVAAITSSVASMDGQLDDVDEWPSDLSKRPADGNSRLL